MVAVLPRPASGTAHRNVSDPSSVALQGCTFCYTPHRTPAPGEADGVHELARQRAEQMPPSRAVTAEHDPRFAYRPVLAAPYIVKDYVGSYVADDEPTLYRLDEGLLLSV